MIARIGLKEQKKSQPRARQVGLMNPGAVCYLNATMQMLFAVKEFRKAVLAVEGRGPVTLQVQRMFRFLELSQRRDYSPEALCQSFSPPINPKIQQDTSEYFNSLFNII